jgi:membrane complex biogenesis BtpA family protein
MLKFKQIFSKKHTIIGMIHVLALPGTPKYRGSIQEIIDLSVSEAALYKKAGIDALMIENMHDVPYTKNEVGAEINSVMTLVAKAIKDEVGLPSGIQILAGANKTALAVAKATGLEFIRAEGFVFGHVADEGYIDSQAADLLRYRKMIDAENIAIFTDIKKKHSAHAITADVDIVDTAHAAEFFLSDGLIITGKQTGHSADVKEIKAVSKSVHIPVLIGSGVTLENLETFLPLADALIVGSYFKENGYWENTLNYRRIADFMEKVNQIS